MYRKKEEAGPGCWEGTDGQTDGQTALPAGLGRGSAAGGATAPSRGRRAPPARSARRAAGEAAPSPAPAPGSSPGSITACSGLQDSRTAGTRLHRGSPKRARRAAAAASPPEHCKAQGPGMLLPAGTDPAGPAEIRGELTSGSLGGKKRANGDFPAGKCWGSTEGERHAPGHSRARGKRPGNRRYCRARRRRSVPPALLRQAGPGCARKIVASPGPCGRTDPPQQAEGPSRPRPGRWPAAEAGRQRPLTAKRCSQRKDSKSCGKPRAVPRRLQHLPLTPTSTRSGRWRAVSPPGPNFAFLSSISKAEPS